MGAGDAARPPRRRRWPELRESRRRGIFLLPSLLTTGNLVAGVLAILLTMNGRYQDASLAILVAILLDILDGKVARLTHTTTQFGLEYDSLADVVSFCVAPAVMLYAWALAPLGRTAWLGAFLFVICGALRLARFNVSTGLTDRRFFVGLPTPAAAGLVASGVLLLGDQGLPRWGLTAIGAATYVVAVLMVSTFRYWSFKEVDLSRRHRVGILVAVVLAAGIVAVAPHVFLFLLFGLYVLSGPARRAWLRKPEPAVGVDAERKDHP
jgi:CDP-diacylglycerol--serine O-phosphatidyltransferase